MPVDAGTIASCAPPRGVVRGTPSGVAEDQPGMGPAEDPREGMGVTQLADAVRRRRAELGLRQAEVAELAGCSERFLHTLEHSKTSVRLDKVLDVLEVLGLGLAVVPGHGRITSSTGGEAGGGGRS